MKISIKIMLGIFCILIFKTNDAMSKSAIEHYRYERDAALKKELLDIEKMTDQEKDARLQKLYVHLQTDINFQKSSSCLGSIIAACVGCFSFVSLGFAWNELSKEHDDCVVGRTQCFYCMACVACTGSCLVTGMAICECCQAKRYKKQSVEIKKLIERGNAIRQLEQKSPDQKKHLE